MSQRKPLTVRTTVNPFEGCPNSRPTNIMTWWRGKHPNLLTMAHAKTIGERAAKILRDHRDLVDARKMTTTTIRDSWRRWSATPSPR